MTVLMRRSIVGLLVVVAVAAAVLAWNGARGQVGHAPEPTGQIRVSDTVRAPVGEGSDGLAVTQNDGVTQSRLGSTSVDAVTTACPDGRSSRTRLGLMEHTSLQSYCHGLTAAR